jgi:hypothetical protein
LVRVTLAPGVDDLTAGLQHQHRIVVVIVQDGVASGIESHRATVTTAANTNVAPG